MSFAVYDFLRQRDTIVALAVTWAALYLAALGAAAKYQDALHQRADLGQSFRVQIVANEVLVLKEGALKRGYHLIRERGSDLLRVLAARRTP